jgi:MFS family permease
MATKLEATTVQAAGVVQGIALVTFPALSTVFTDPDEYGMSTTAYGAIFVPQAVTAITAAVLGALWSRHVPARRLYLSGLVANLAAMTLLVVSAAVMDDDALAYACLMVATASLGIGFGLTVPALNTFTAAFNPARVDGSVLVLNALLGLGTALAPVFVAIFVGLGLWWGLPIAAAGLLAVLIGVSLRLPFELPRPPAASRARSGLPRRFWLYAAFAVGYGICETMNGNWSSIDMQQLGGSTTVAALALTTFWACVTLGRVGFAALRSMLPTPRTYRLLPLVLAVAFIAVAALPDDAPVLGVAAFGLAGIGCSALLPLTISFGQEELRGMTAAVASGVIACYQVGYGVAAFGAGPLQDAGVELSTLFGIAAVVALGLGAGAFVITRSKEPSAVPAIGAAGPVST